MRRLLFSPSLVAIALVALTVGLGGHFGAKPQPRRQARTFSPVAEHMIRQALGPLGSGGPGLKGGGCPSSSASCTFASSTTTGTSTAGSFTSTAASGSAFFTATGGNTIGIGQSGYTGFTFNNIVNNTSTGVGFLSHAASGTDAFKVDTNGARFHFGTGAADYASSDGSTVTFANHVAVAGSLWGKTTFALGSGGATFMSGTAPTITGFGTSPSVTTNNGTAAFTINVGTGGTASSGTITLPAATNGWVCNCQDITTTSATVFVTKQTASTTTTCVVGNFNTSGASAAWAASDILHCTAMGR